MLVTRMTTTLESYLKKKFLPKGKYPYGVGHSSGSGMTRSSSGSCAVRIALTKFSGTSV